MPAIYIILFLGLLALNAVACNLIAKKRGANPTFWGAMGLLFGPLAIPFVFMSRKGGAHA
jgi:hypothetical protein